MKTGKSWKKRLSVFLCVTLIAVSVPMTVFAADAKANA